MSKPNTQKEPHIIVKDLTMAYGSFVVQRDLTFTINHGDIFIIMGGSGCGKSTLMRHMVGLKAPAKGQVLYDGSAFGNPIPLTETCLCEKSAYRTRAAPYSVP